MNHREPEYMANVKPRKSGIPQLNACTFNVGGRTFSIPLQYVKEITEVSEIFPLPLAPPYVDGIVHLRGLAIPVINIGKIKNIMEEQKKVRQLIILDSESDIFGIAVNEMPDLNAEFLGELINVKNFYNQYRIA
ncbi:MAG TPA: chemotaxis protein CheW [Nitrospirae bacterium]|nr:chemotaxis protein CheW [Nitrospirota bacterium]